MGNQALGTLIRLAIGPDRTQEQFAQDAGISSSRLSALLADDNETQPRPSLIQKIADASEGRVTEKALLISSGLLAEGEINDVFLRKLMLSIKKCKNIRLYDDLLSFLSFVGEDSSTGANAGVVFSSSRYCGDLYPLAERKATAVMYYISDDSAGQEFQCATFTLYYSQTVSGKYHIVDCIPR